MTKSRLNSLLALLLAVSPALSLASEGGAAMESAQIDLTDKASLQRGAALYMSYCSGCHSLGYLGMQSGSTTQTLVARLLTAFYFGFFIFMPFWSRLGATKPVPDRVTMHD